MSTYTDLKNRVKETITVGFRPEDRVTTQKVRFYNEENEYWGSFSGSLSGKVNIKTGNLLSVDIYDSTLINPILKTKEGTIIDLGTMGNQLEELSTYVYEDIKTSVDTNYELITQLSNAISAVPLDTESQLSNLDFRLNNLSTECKQAMSDEVSARISSDNQLSLSFDSKLTTLAQDVAKEDEKLRSEINNLSEQLNTETITRISEDEKLSVNLSKYADRKRHYDLFSMDMASQMPIKAKEFAVNKLINYNVPDGFVINNNAGGQVIGCIEDYNDTTKACKFTAYSDADYTVTNEDGIKYYPYSQILGLNPYIFDGSQTRKPCANNVHVINYNNSGEFNDHQFDIRLMKSNIRNIVYGGSVVGHIYGAGTTEEVSAGTLQFSPTAIINNSILSVFADSKEIPFSINLDNGEIDDYDNGNSILRIQPSYPRAEHGYLYITEASENGQEFRELNFCKEYISNKYKEIKNNDIVIEIPNKEDGSTISREFLFVINPTSTNNTKVNLKFVTEQGDPIDFFTEGRTNEFEIDCGKYITFRLQEITHNKFVLLDWDQSVQESRLDSLDNRLESEINNRINAINNLSIALSNEIIDLSIGLSTEIKSLSSVLSTEINNLSTALSTEIDSLSGNVYEVLNKHNEKLSADRKDINFLLYVDRESMVYKGTLLSVDDTKDKTLSCYFKNALNIGDDPQFMFKHGFTYRISADQDLIDYNNTNIVLRLGDVITFNQDSRISSVCAEDFDIIHDYQIPLNNLSTALSTEIDSLSSGLSTEIDNKFTLQSTTSKLSGEYNDLNNFVNRTLIDEDKENQSKPGIVKIQDEFRYAAENDLRNYEMRMISGTIKLVKISK